MTSSLDRVFEMYDKVCFGLVLDQLISRLSRAVEIRMTGVTTIHVE